MDSELSLQELRETVKAQLIAARGRIRSDAWRWPYVSPVVLESVVGALGDISVVEAREALARLNSEAEAHSLPQQEKDDDGQ